MYDCHCARMQRMLRWEMYKGSMYCTDCCEIMYTCMAKEYTLINCMALTENIFFTHARAKGVCVYRGLLRHSKDF